MAGCAEVFGLGCAWVDLLQGEVPFYSLAMWRTVLFSMVAAHAYCRATGLLDHHVLCIDMQGALQVAIGSATAAQPTPQAEPDLLGFYDAPPPPAAAVPPTPATPAPEPLAGAASFPSGGSGGPSSRGPPAPPPAAAVDPFGSPTAFSVAGGGSAGPPGVAGRGSGTRGNGNPFHAPAAAHDNPFGSGGGSAAHDSPFGGGGGGRSAAGQLGGGSEGAYGGFGQSAGGATGPPAAAPSTGLAQQRPPVLAGASR